MTQFRMDVPGASYTTFGALFAGDNRYHVPDYQRAYDWGPKERRDLFEDLERLDQLFEAGQDASHFCGTVICTPPEKVKGSYAVVDGQQRLTTLALIHARLSRATGQPTFVYSEGRVRFVPQSGDASRFTELLAGHRPGDASTAAQSRYIDAAAEIDAWIGADATRAARMLKHVEKRLHLIFFILADETEVAKVFETINNRGKSLSQMDLVKNHLIYVAAVRGWNEPGVNEIWTRIQQIGFEGQMDNVLRAVVTAQFRPGRRKAGESDFDIVSRNLPAREATHETFSTFLRFLESSFQTYGDMRNANDTDERRPVLRALTLLNHHAGLAGVLPLIFARQFRREDGTIEAKDAGVLEAIEITNFRLYGLPGASARSDSHNVTLQALAHDYFLGRKTDDEVIAALRAIVTRSQKDGLADIVRLLTLDDSEDYDYHHWAWLRYFLARYEESLLDRQSFDFSRLRLRVGQTSRTNDVLTIEHIWPRNAVSGAVADDNDGQQLRRLGNLMLLSHRLNVQRSNGDLEFKDRKTEDARVVTLKQNDRASLAARKARDFADHLAARGDARFGDASKSFYKPTIEANYEIVRIRTMCDLREEEMIAFALKAWRFPGETGRRQAFRGMFSLPQQDESFLVTREHAGNKGNENHVLGARHPAGLEMPAAQRLAARREVLDMGIDDVDWT